MTNKNISHGSSFGYRGRVSVQVKERNKILAAHIKQNSGLTKLFANLCKALSGEASFAEVRPATISLYSLPEGSTTYVNATWEVISSATVGESNATSKPLLRAIVSNMPVIATFRDTGDSPAVVFQASIPYAQIAEGEDIYLMALYPAGTSNTADALAYYKMSNANGWTPIHIDSSKSDKSLLIEWQMDFNNQKNKE